MTEAPHAHEPQRKRRLFILLVVAGVLFVLNWILGFSFYQKKKQLEATQAALEETRRLKEELEAELATFQQEVARYRGEVATLDSIIAAQNHELEARAEEIRKLLQQGKVSRQQLARARRELERLRYLVDEYKYRLDSLYEENKRLQEENIKLKTAVSQYKQEREQLKDENVKLKIKLAVGSRLATSDIEVLAFRVRRGKERPTSRAKRVEHLRVCFKLVDNPVADYGTYTVYVRIINPHGETLSIENAGGGTTTLDGQEVLYSFKGAIDFKNTPSTQYCLEWQVPTPLAPGDYKIQLITKDYSMGETTLKLK